MKFGVCVFPGSNCDYDTYYVIRDVLERDVRFIYHNETDLKDVDVLILPGGFSFGDYVRPGLLASKTALMDAVIDFAHKGGIVLGICNGFQILTEAGLLPGALLPNINGRFICKDVYIRIETNSRILTNKLKKGEALRLPIAHHDGRYYVDDKTLKELEENEQIIFRYADKEGNANGETNPNGSISNIAGICNKEGNVFGMMPHPERASEDVLGNHDGLMLWYSLIS